MIPTFLLVVFVLAVLISLMMKIMVLVVMLLYVVAVTARGALLRGVVRACLVLRVAAMASRSQKTRSRDETELAACKTLARLPTGPGVGRAAGGPGRGAAGVSTPLAPRGVEPTRGITSAITKP